MQTSPLDYILVIDEMPPVSLGLQVVFRTINPSVRIEHTDSIFTALSSKSYQDKVFDLIIIGSQPGSIPESLRQSVEGIKERFGKARIMLYTATYDHYIIEKMEELGIDAYIHKYEDIDEIRYAYTRLSAGERYISGIFHTLYFEYCLDVEK